MSAAVMQHPSSRPVSNPGSRLGTNSPVDNKRVNIKNEESSPQTFNRDINSKLNQSTLFSATPDEPINSPQVPIDQPPEEGLSKESDIASKANSRERESERPNNTSGNTAAGTPDYFSLPPRPSRLDQEPNPFEQSFASNSHPGSADPLSTPKSLLPPVAAMTSPAPLMPGGAPYWGSNSLRNGPLSPAMLQGPANGSNPLGFDSHLRTGLTPNESGIRSGLTPGGSGSLFPQPSPSTSLFQNFGGGGATPSTMEFHKTALSAARKSQPPPSMLSTQPGHELKGSDNIPQINHGMNNTSEQSSQKPRQPSDPFGHDPAHNAANGLYLLANQIPNGFQQAPQIPVSNPGGTMESSPNLAKRAVVNNAASHSGHAANRSMSGSSISNTVRGASELSNDMSDSSQEQETPAAGSRKRNARGKGAAAATGKRKNDDGSTKGGSSKKSKAAPPRSQASDDGENDEREDDGLEEGGEGKGKDTKKMTDEEKRKNFLERNRVAALKCRQRKKQWLANLQAKVELYGSENDALNATVQQLREEIVSLKTLLLAHKDCPIARQNGVQLDIATLGGDYAQVPMMAGYGGMGLPPGVMQHHQPGAERRYS